MAALPVITCMAPILVALLTALLTLGACAPWQAAADSRSKPVSYVALGASDAVGVGARQPEQEGWVPRFHTRLPAGSSLTNLGVSGSLLGQALDQQLPVALAARPNVVTVWLAVNDLNARVPLERYAKELDRLLATLEPSGAKVLVGNIPDVAQLPVYRVLDARAVRGRISNWNAVIAAAAARHGAILVDLHSTWRELAEHPEYVSADGFHPSAEGYARLADLFWEALIANGGLSVSDGG